MDSENFKIINVTRDLVTIEIIDPSKFEGQFNIGSYVKIPYNKDSEKFIIGVIENYRIKNLNSEDVQTQVLDPHFLIEIKLVGTYTKGSEEEHSFIRGAHGIPLPPNNGIEILSDEDYENIYCCNIPDKERFIFSQLIQNKNVKLPVNGNKLFNKHFAIVGSTGSGKSHTVASVIQKAVDEKVSGGYEGLNNSHIIIFDIHGEYKRAFPSANYINSENIKIPYWLFDSEELGDLFIESNEDNSHNQVSQFRYAVTENKIKENPSVDKSKIYFDSPLKFKMEEIIQYIKNINNELVNKKNARNPETKDGVTISDRIPLYFEKELEFEKISADFVNGPYSGDFERFILRLENTIKNPRLKFLFKDVYDLSLEDILKQFLGYGENNYNVTVIDLSGIPFEVLSITVSLISRLLFEYGYYYNKILTGDVNCETPLLLVYEEAHKYVPRSDLVKYRASKNAIERIAKEGRKYGVTLCIVSQRPAEISETIFSQCNNFIIMRLTNPDDQNYVKKLLPDTLGDLTNNLSTLQSGEALLIGESITLPSVVKVDFPKHEPKSTDIKYLDIWKEQLKTNIEFEKIITEWKK